MSGQGQTQSSGGAPPITGNRRPLTADDVRARLKEHIYVLYLNYSFFIKGAVIAVAGLTLFLIWVPDTVAFRYERLAMWFASVGFSMVTIATWTRGAPLANARASFFDMVIPVAMGICEVLFFTIIAPPQALHPTDHANLFWTNWYGVFAFHGMLAVILVANRLYAADSSEFVHDQVLNPIWQQYRDWLRFDIGGASVVTVLGAGMFYACQKLPYLKTQDAVVWHTGVGVAVFLMSLFVIAKAAYDYNTISRI